MQDLEIAIVGFADALTASGLVIVIDVLRAFSTAAYAVRAGTREILLAHPAAEALATARRLGKVPIAGEVAGVRPCGFDLDNSPAAAAARYIAASAGGAMPAAAQEAAWGRLTAIVSTNLVP